MLSREMVDAPSLEMFQARLDGALRNLIWLKMSLSREVVESPSLAVFKRWLDEELQDTV